MFRRALPITLTLIVAACAKAPVVVAPIVPTVPFEEKVAAIVRLEDQRMLRNPAPGDWLNWRRTDNAWGYSTRCVDLMEKAHKLG